MSKKKRRRKKRESPRSVVTEEVKAHLSAEREAALRDAELATRRQYARFVVGGKTKGRITAVYDAVIVNVSLGGSLIEHADIVRPGTISCLDFEVMGKRLRVSCRVVRSVVHRSDVLASGERELVYHTGLQFLEPSEEIRKVISDYIQSLVDTRPQPVVTSLGESDHSVSALLLDPQDNDSGTQETPSPSE